MKKEKENILFEVNSEWNLKEYRKLLKTSPFPFLKEIIWIILLVLAFSLPHSTYFGGTDSMSSIIIVDTILIILILIFSKIFEPTFAKKSFERISKDKGIDLKFKIDFYENHFEHIGTHGTFRLQYEELMKVLETKENIYLFVDKNTVCIIQKKNSDLKLIEFLKSRKLNCYICKEKKKSRKLNNKKNSLVERNINKIMLILFILTILTVPFMFLIPELLIKNDRAPNELLFSYMWGVLYMLPFPILSIVLGIKYKKDGIKCIKNIVSGFIVGIIIILVGCTGLAFNSDYLINYIEVNNYNEIVGIKLPDKGKYYKINYDNDYLKNYINNYIIFQEESAATFFSTIKASQNWFLSKNIKPNLNKLVKYDLICEGKKECYFSICVKELDNYNVLPTESGEYHVYAMMYDPDKRFLNIKEYLLNYNN